MASQTQQEVSEGYLLGQVIGKIQKIDSFDEEWQAQDRASAKMWLQSNFHQNEEISLQKLVTKENSQPADSQNRKIIQKLKKLISINQQESSNSSSSSFNMNRNSSSSLSSSHEDIDKQKQQQQQQSPQQQ